MALCCGRLKPDNLEFLSETIRDLKTLMEHGLYDREDEKTYAVALWCIICDAPAKAMVK